MQISRLHDFNTHNVLFFPRLVSFYSVLRNEISINVLDKQFLRVIEIRYDAKQLPTFERFSETRKFGITRVNRGQVYRKKCNEAGVSSVSPSSERISFVIFREGITKLTFRARALRQSFAPCVST